MTTVKVENLTNLGTIQLGDNLVGERVVGQTRQVKFNNINDINGNAILTMTSVASAINNINIANSASGGAVIISSAGSSSDIPFVIQSKGTGIIGFKSAQSSGPIQFQTGTSYQHTTSFSFTDSNNSRTITFPDASGTATILGNTTTGTGSTIVLNSSPAITTPSITTGLNDSAGQSILKLNSTSSAANTFQIAQGTTGNSPILSSVGGDTNIGQIFLAQNAGGFVMKTTAVSGQWLLLTGTSYQHTTGFNFPSTNASQTVTWPDATGTVTLLGNSSTGSGNVVLATSPTLTSPTFTSPVLGTPSSGTLSNCTGYTVGNISGLGTGVATWLATPTSANLASAVATTSTGSGALVFGTGPTLSAPILGIPASGTLTNCTGVPSGTGIACTATNNSASTGQLGEYISSNLPIASAINVPNNTATNITSISLTAGDWMVFGNVALLPTGICTTIGGAVNTTSSSVPDFSQYSQLTNNGGWGNSGITVPPLRVSISGTTTVYLIAVTTFSTGSCTGCGTIQARRMR